MKMTFVYNIVFRHKNTHSVKVRAWVLAETLEAALVKFQNWWGLTQKADIKDFKLCDLETRVEGFIDVL